MKFLLTLFLLTCLQAVHFTPTTRAGYDAATNLEADLKRTVALQFYALGSERRLVPQGALIREGAEVGTFCALLARVSFIPQPNSIRSIGRSIWVALLDVDGHPLLLVDCFQFSETLNLRSALRRESGELELVRTNVHHDPPNFSAQDREFVVCLRQLYTKYCPAEWAALRDTLF